MEDIGRKEKGGLQGLVAYEAAQSRAWLWELPLSAPSERVQWVAASEIDEANLDSKLPGATSYVMLARQPEAGGVALTPPVSPNHNVIPVGPVPTSRSRGAMGLWAAVILLSLAVAGVTLYGYETLRQNNIPLSRMPGMRTLADRFAARPDVTEAHSYDLTTSLNKLLRHATELSRKLDPSATAADSQTQDAAGSPEQIRTEARSTTDGSPVDASPARADSNPQLLPAPPVPKNGSARQSGVVRQSDSGQGPARVKQSPAQAGTPNSDARLEKVSFEVSRDNPAELAPGISFNVTRLNVALQRFDGYVTVADEGRTLRLHDIDAEQSVVFYSNRSGESYELVVTAVNSNGVAGYLMMPPAESRSGGRPGDTVGMLRPSF